MSTAEQSFETWKETCKIETEYVSPEEEDATIALSERLLQENEEVREAFAVAIYNGIKGNIYHKIWLYSFAISLFPKAEWIKELLVLVLDTDELNWHTLYFLYGQIASNIFRNSALETEDNIYLKWKLLVKTYQVCRLDIAVPLKRIPKQERDENMSVVLVEQFLTQAHGPTKTALDRCYTLKSTMGKKVLLINTAELMSFCGMIPFFNTLGGTYVTALREKETQYWKNEAIPYFQCENDMPNAAMMEMLLQTIYQIKPAIVVCVGGSSLFAGLVNELVPVLTVGTTQSGIAVTLAEHQVTSKELIVLNRNLVKRINKGTKHMLEGDFTFSLKQQTEFVTRTEVGILDSAFVIGVIGGRLDTEITEDLLTLFERVVGKNVVVFVIGKYDSYEMNMEKHSDLKEYVYYNGFSGDILSRIELCDLYLNPLRKGGGTSAVEAMYKGKPVVTIAYGDVAGIVGEDFCCADYSEMEKEIKRYASDREYYAIQSQKAKRLSEKYLDSEREFKRIIEEYLRIMN